MPDLNGVTCAGVYVAKKKLPLTQSRMHLSALKFSLLKTALQPACSVKQKSVVVIGGCEILCWPCCPCGCVFIGGYKNIGDDAT